MPVPRQCTPSLLTCVGYFSSFLTGVRKNKTGEGRGGGAEINQWLLGVFPPQESIIPVISLSVQCKDAKSRRSVLLCAFFASVPGQKTKPPPAPVSRPQLDGSIRGALKLLAGSLPASKCHCPSWEDIRTCSRGPSDIILNLRRYLLVPSLCCFVCVQDVARALHSISISVLFCLTSSFRVPGHPPPQRASFLYQEESLLRDL